MPDSSIPGTPPEDKPFRDRVGGQPPIRLGGRLPGDLVREERDQLAERGQFLRQQQLDTVTAERNALRGTVAARDAEIALLRARLQPGSPQEILPPPRAVVTAAYLTVGASGPGILLEVCPCCTAHATLDTRDCFCRVPCAWAGCRWDDPANLNAVARKADAARRAATLPADIPLRLARCPEHPGDVHAQLGSAGEWACLRGLADLAEAGIPKRKGAEAAGDYPPVPVPAAAWVTFDELAAAVGRSMPRVHSIERADGWAAARVEDPREFAWGLLQQCAGWDPDAEPPALDGGPR